jgi:hypothetical protein
LAGRLRRVLGQQVESNSGEPVYRLAEGHHRKLTFEQEFIALLKKHGVDYDPKFVFG